MVVSMDISRLFQGFFKGCSKVFPDCFKNALRVIFKGGSSLFQKCFKSVSDMFLECFITAKVACFS